MVDPERITIQVPTALRNGIKKDLIDSGHFRNLSDFFRHSARVEYERFKVKKRDETLVELLMKDKIDFDTAISLSTMPVDEFMLKVAETGYDIGDRLKKSVPEMSTNINTKDIGTKFLDYFLSETRWDRKSNITHKFNWDEKRGDTSYTFDLAIIYVKSIFRIKFLIKITDKYIDGEELLRYKQLYDDLLFDMPKRETVHIILISTRGFSRAAKYAVEQPKFWSNRGYQLVYLYLYDGLNFELISGGRYIKRRISK